MPTVWVPDVAISLDTMTCGECHITFAVPASLKAKRMEDHQSWYCPNGHQRHFVGQSEADKLRDQLAREKASSDQIKASRDYWIEKQSATERSLRATKAVVTRTKKKIVAGRCPCCSHKFKDLAVHMTTRHPNYDPAKAATALEAKV
jgi:hypothetical protein